MPVDRPEIICTLGPACFAPEVIDGLAEAGATGIRVPFSKETVEAQLQAPSRYKNVISRWPDLKLFADLPGAVCRTANDEDRVLDSGMLLGLSAAGDQGSGLLPIRYAQGLLLASAGLSISFGDGEITATIERIDRGRTVWTRVDLGGVLRPRRAITWRGSGSHTSPMSERDLAALNDPRMSEFDGVMVSHITTANQVVEGRRAIPPTLSLVSKVESGLGVSAIGDIGAVSDAVLIGLGDLLNDVGEDGFYPAIRQILKWNQSKPSTTKLILGTQLLEATADGQSNRCELLNLGQLADAGIDGVLLSAETTIGRYPIRAVVTARRLLEDKQRGF